jgi:hypothetical protein
MNSVLTFNVFKMFNILHTKAILFCHKFQAMHLLSCKIEKTNRHKTFNAD